jgi:hypothetical protein
MNPAVVVFHPACPSHPGQLAALKRLIFTQKAAFGCIYRHPVEKLLLDFGEVYSSSLSNSPAVINGGKTVVARMAAITATAITLCRKTAFIISGEYIELSPV